MAKRSTYTVGPDVPDREVLRDSQGRVVDDEYVEAAVQDALRQARGRGRPSLSESGESPLLRVRLSGDLDAAVRKAAEKAGTSRSDWVRQVLAKAVRKTG
jgi:predicted HicB family RNase H-like nuclease